MPSAWCSCIQYRALARFDGTALYEHADPRRGAHPEWGTLIYNYGRHEVRNFLTASALFWPREYHADGIRVDAVASMLYLDYSRPEGAWVPNEFGGNEDLEAVEFLKGMNETLYRREPGIVSAAEITPGSRPYRTSFICLRNETASRSSRPPNWFGTHSPALRE